MRSYLLPLSILTFTLSFPALAWDVRTDSDGDVVRWKGKVEMVLDASASSALRESETENAIRAAFVHFDEATPNLEVTLKVGSAQAIGYRPGAKDNQNSIIVLDEWPYDESALAVTLVTINARTNELLDADIAFNAAGHQFRVLKNSKKEERTFDDVQNTFTHELGHVLGLMHNKELEDLVMYPSAPPGEISKRALKQDDRDGLLSLYGAALEGASANEQTAGCSASSAPPLSMLLGLLMFFFRNRRAALVAACVPALALAGESMPVSLANAQDVALVQVVSRQSGTHSLNPGLIVTELSFDSVECLKGTCLNVSRVVVPGGRLGDLEQLIVHEPVPEAGTQVLIYRSAGRLRVAHLEAEAQGEVVKILRAKGSVAPQTAIGPLPASSKMPAITP